MPVGNRLSRFFYNSSPAKMRDLMATLYSRQRGKIKFGPKFYEYLSDLERTQWYDEEELNNLQVEKLRKLIHYASNYVPTYRRLFMDLGLKPRDICNVSDLVRFPVTEKSNVQSNLGDFRSDLYQDDNLVERFQSSGTTGKALDVYISKDCLQLEKAFTWLHRSWGGIKMGDKSAAFVGFPVVPTRRKIPPFWVYDRSENRMIFSLQHMSQKNMPAFVKQLELLDPTFITGYPTAIYLIALHFCDAGNHSIHPKAVFTASETLLPHQRKVIESAFNCPVFDWYGAVEMIANIVQCELGNYHIKAEYGIVEILNKDGTSTSAGQGGELFCTGLNNFAMPFLRYRVGDTAVPKSGKCDCGRGGQLVEYIIGRTEDIIVTPDGRYLSRLDFVFKGLLNVEEAQLIQEDPGHLRVRFVKGPGFNDQDTTLILSNLRERLGDEIRIVFEEVDRIPRTSNGKFRYVISKVPLSFTDSRQTGDVLGLSAEEEKTL